MSDNPPTDDIAAVLHQLHAAVHWVTSADNPNPLLLKLVHDTLAQAAERIARAADFVDETAAVGGEVSGL
jgi:hypothetical protein